MSGSDASSQVGDRIVALGHWARALRLADVPDDVQRLARLQLAHVGARVAEAHAAGVESLALAGRDAATYAEFDGDGHIYGGRTGVGVAVLREAAGGGATVGDLVLAVVVGMEIGARIGLATLYSDRLTASSPGPGAATGAAALARLGGADGDAIAAAVVGALNLARPGATGAAFGTGVVEAALGGAAGRGGTDAGILWRDVAEPLPDVLVAPSGGAGWLTRSLVLPRLCAPPALATVLEGLDEILKRHFKAADKRLRAEQVERIEVRLCLPAWASEQVRPQAPDLIGRLVAFHALGVAERTASDERAAEVAAVAERVEVLHDVVLTAGFARSCGAAVGALNLRRMMAVRGLLRHAGAWPALGLADVGGVVRARPDRLFRAAPAGGGVAPLVWPVQIKLYTTRGGWWPERRERAESVDADPVAPFDGPLASPAGPLLGAA